MAEDIEELRALLTEQGARQAEQAAEISELRRELARVKAAPRADDLLCVKQAAAFFQAHESTVRRWAKDDPSITIRPGGKILISVSQVINLKSSKMLKNA